MINKAINFHEDSDDKAWLVTFADLVTLLLVFFILLFSVSTIKEDSFNETIDSVKSALNNTGEGSTAGAGSGTKEDVDSKKAEIGTVATDSLDPSVETGDKQQAPTEEVKPIIATPLAIIKTAQEERIKQRELTEVSESINRLMKSAAGENDSKVSAPKDDKILINIRGDLFFNKGSAQFKRESMPIMDGIGNILRKHPEFKLAIGGHTDNIPISTNRYPTNWELSAIRATTVLRYFIRGGMQPDRVTATGYGESMPIQANDTEQQQSENRRIEFVLERKSQ